MHLTPSIKQDVFDVELDLAVKKNDPDLYKTVKTRLHPIDKLEVSFTGTEYKSARIGPLDFSGKEPSYDNGKLKIAKNFISTNGITVSKNAKGTSLNYKNKLKITPESFQLNDKNISINLKPDATYVKIKDVSFSQKKGLTTITRAQSKLVIGDNKVGLIHNGMALAFDNGVISYRDSEKIIATNHIKLTYANTNIEWKPNILTLARKYKGDGFEITGLAYDGKLALVGQVKDAQKSINVSYGERGINLKASYHTTF